MRRAWILGLWVLAACAQAQSIFRARVVGVTDGDTIKVLVATKQGKTQYKVRISGIDAPEGGQAFGSSAKRRMSELAFGRDATLTLTGKGSDQYGRLTAYVVVGGKDVGLELVRAGLAWAYTKYLYGNRALPAAERNARAKRLGLWADPSAVPPWKWRSVRKVNEIF